MAVDVSMWSSEAWSSAADMYLLARTREGSDEAFAELWRRHLPAAHAVANAYKRHAPAEDIVAEAATRVLALLKEGRGPEENFRAYFLSAVRSVAVDSARRDLKVVPTPDEDLDDLMEPVVEEFDSEGFDPELVRRAFDQLPERDQRVLWHTTVEGQAPRLVGPALGMSANAVSARAMRAREALRVAYLEAHAGEHLHGAESAECRWAISVLGAHVRDRLSKRASDRLDTHLAGCEHESALLVELHTLHDRFPALLVPLIFLAGVSTPGFLGGAAALAGAGSLAAPALDGEAVGAAEAVGPAGEPGTAIGDAAEPATTGAAGPDVVSGLASKAAAVASVAVIAAGVLGAAGAPDLPMAARPATVASTASPLPSSVTPSSATPRSSSTAATTAASSTTVPATTTTTTTASPSATAPAAPPARVLPPPPPSGTHSVDLKIIASGTPTRFSLRFSSPTSGTLRVSVSNVSGGGRLTVDNDAFTCRNTSRSSVACSGRTGQVMLSQSGLSRSEPVVVRVTDRTGATSTRTLSLR